MCAWKVHIMDCVLQVTMIIIDDVIRIIITTEPNTFWTFTQWLSIQNFFFVFRLILWFCRSHHIFWKFNICGTYFLLWDLRIEFNIERLSSNLPVLIFWSDDFKRIPPYLPLPHDLQKKSCFYHNSTTDHCNVIRNLHQCGIQKN